MANYWLVGASYGANDDQTEPFVKEGVWRNGGVIVKSGVWASGGFPV